jgi:hypothetical protein
MKENRPEDVNMWPVGLANTRISTNYDAKKNSPITGWFPSPIIYLHVADLVVFWCILKIWLEVLEKVLMNFT